jgi:hypothetical protein
MSVKMRQRVEKIIVRAVVNAAVAAGYSVAVDNGGDEYEYKGADRRACLATMFATDDERLYLFTAEQAARGFKRSAGWVYFVYGNSGWDVISDYTTNLENLLAPALKLAEKYE